MTPEISNPLPNNSATRVEPESLLPELIPESSEMELGQAPGTLEIETIPPTASSGLDSLLTGTIDLPLEQETQALDQPEIEAVAASLSPLDLPPVSDSSAAILSLEETKQQLTAEILALQTQKATLLSEQLNTVQAAMEKLVTENIRSLEQRKQSLEVEIERLERRQDRIQQEMRTTFAGVSQELAIRVQGFKDYLVGSLQDLVMAAEELELTNSDPWTVAAASPEPIVNQTDNNPKVTFAEQSFEEQRRQIQRLLEQYRTRPDYYGPPWQLRRTFEPVHLERVQSWFFSQGGRGVIKSMGSRLQNILMGSAVISVLANLYGGKEGLSPRSRALILANSPERLGEWRRGLQDCLGISRTDFGPERGIVLFESPDALIQKAERLVEERLLPLVLIDDTQEQVDLALLQFPLWLAFAPDSSQPASNYFY